jgi:hypothetical protein
VLARVLAALWGALLVARKELWPLRPQRRLVLRVGLGVLQARLLALVRQQLLMLKELQAYLAERQL